MSNKIFLIGIGHKARQGKDTVANFIKKLNTPENVFIYHFADPLKEEVMNTDRRYPLIYRDKQHILDKYWYSIQSVDSEYITTPEEKVPFLHKIFKDRGIDIYWGMDGNGSDTKKDSSMLQFWGTNWRRQRFGDDYWVSRVEEYFRKNFYNKQFIDNAFFLVPDARFPNEVQWIRDWSNESVMSVYLDVVRKNEDGTQYYDPSRDKNHPSEISLDGITPDYTIEAKSGDLKTLELETEKFMEVLKIGRCND